MGEARNLIAMVMTVTMIIRMGMIMTVTPMQMSTTLNAQCLL